MSAPSQPVFAGHRFPAEMIGHAVYLAFHFPLSLRMVEEMLAARGIIVSHGRAADRIDGRQWGLKFGREIANRIRRRVPWLGDKSGTWTRVRQERTDSDVRAVLRMR